MPDTQHNVRYSMGFDLGQAAPEYLSHSFDQLASVFFKRDITSRSVRSKRKGVTDTPPWVTTKVSLSSKSGRS